jgi:hypothetical protein
MTYELDGRQYIMNGSGSVLFVWALPERMIAAQHTAAKPH